jgi:phosphoribosylamine--glycine ligase
MKTILLIGNGGREHALAEALTRSPQMKKLYNFASGINPGIKALGAEIIIGNILNMEELKTVAQQIKPDLAIVGPEDPIGLGAADILRTLSIPTFAPSKAGGQLESSKSFTRNLLARYDIDASPAFMVCIDGEDKAGRQSFYDKFAGQIVVKADGLLGGKGVIIADDHFSCFDEVEDFAQQSIQKFGRVVLEEKLVGEEFSLISIVDGETVLDCPIIQDHKRAFEGDAGPNTGGMGCISDEKGSLPFLTKADHRAAHDITVQVMHALEKELGEKYVGIMYGGFMVTAHGVKLIEYNARFGDPEALNILPILETDFVEVCLKAAEGKLRDIEALKFKPLATVVKYLCPKGYPTEPVENIPIEVATVVSEQPVPQQSNSAQVFYASVVEEGGALILKGSRAIGVAGMGGNLEVARQNCEAMIQHFSGPLFYRKDIGTEVLMQKRIDHVKSLKK